MTNTPISPQTLALPRLFAKFLRFGCLAFGGPVAQIAMLRQTLVDEEKWISSPRFNRLLAVMQILPGPEAHELCVHMGMVARGRIGGLLAGLGFMLPGFLLMLAAGWAYTDWIAGNAEMAPALHAIQVVTLAIILRAVQRIGGHILEDRLLWAIGAAAFIATLAGVPFFIPLVIAGLAYACARRPAALLAILLGGLAVTLLWWLLGRDLGGIHSRDAGGDYADALALFIAGLKGGLLTFGGAYTAIPYVRADTVGRGWLPDTAFLDGVALAGVLPAPLVIFATFAGYVAGGLTGALAITAGMFLPAFAFSMIFFDHLEALVDHPALQRFLAGVAAAVVGIIAATLIQLGGSTFAQSGNIALSLLFLACALAAVMRFKGRWVIPAVVGAAGLTGWALGAAL